MPSWTSEDELGLVRPAAALLLLLLLLLTDLLIVEPILAILVVTPRREHGILSRRRELIIVKVQAPSRAPPRGQLSRVSPLPAHGMCPPTARREARAVLPQPVPLASVVGASHEESLLCQ